MYNTVYMELGLSSRQGLGLVGGKSCSIVEMIDKTEHKS